MVVIDRFAFESCAPHWGVPWDLVASHWWAQHNHLSWNELDALISRRCTSGARICAPLVASSAVVAAGHGCATHHSRHFSVACVLFHFLGLLKWFALLKIERQSGHKLCFVQHTPLERVLFPESANLALKRVS